METGRWKEKEKKERKKREGEGGRSGSGSDVGRRKGDRRNSVVENFTT